MNCVRWSSNGYVLTTASRDNTVDLIDFGTGKVIYTGTTVDDSIQTWIYKCFKLFSVVEWAMSACFSSF